MVLLLKPTLACNNNCKYCYQKAIKHFFVEYNIDKVLETAERVYKETKMRPIALHGGEPLIMPLKDIEACLKFAYRHTGESSIVTNGLNINDEIIKLFKKYKTIVDISIDGLPHMNILRCNKEKTERIMKNIELLVQEGVKVFPMTVLHKYNKNPKDLLEFINWLRKIGINDIHVMYCRPPEIPTDYMLSPEELLEVFKFLTKIHISSFDFRVDQVDYFISNLCGSPIINDCFMTPCDIFCPERAITILGDGTVTGCMFTNLHIQHFSRLKEPIYVRYMALRKIPVSDGGCGGCKYWTICYGGCPGSATDWRMKDWYCYTFYKIYEYLEENIVKIYRREGLADGVGYEREDPIEDKEVHVVVYRHPKVRINVFRKTTVNSITVIETPEKVEVIYKP